MTIETIKPGGVPRTKWKGTCLNCNGVFTCNEEDLLTHNDLGEGQRGMNMKYIKCPTNGCGKVVMMKILR